jgi:hypothetical protein
MSAMEPMTIPDIHLRREKPAFDPYEFHKWRYLNEAAPMTYRNESAQWLVDKGFIGLNGQMILTNRRDRT